MLFCAGLKQFKQTSDFNVIFFFFCFVLLYIFLKFWVFLKILGYLQLGMNVWCCIVYGPINPQAYVRRREVILEGNDGRHGSTLGNFWPFFLSGLVMIWVEVLVFVSLEIFVFMVWLILEWVLVNDDAHADRAHKFLEPKSFRGNWFWQPQIGIELICAMCANHMVRIQFHLSL